jgi:hypothetical protein
MSNMTMLMLLRRMKRDDLTVHRFRSTFSDWAAGRTAYPREVVEISLAHAIGNKVEAAYRRADLFEKRHRLMADWARFLRGGAHVLTDVGRGDLAAVRKVLYWFLDDHLRRRATAPE